MSNAGGVVTRRSFLAIGGAILAANNGPFASRLAAADNLGADGMSQIDPWTSENPFLRGAFTPVFDERDDADLAVQGDIPRTLRGVFMRNGPNPQFPPDNHYAYPFDGTGMIHALYLENGQARYRNRWVLTREVLAERAARHRIYNSTFSPPPQADLANTNIVYHAGRYLALYEAGIPYELDRDIKTLGAFNYDGNLPSVMSAHPKL
ncbi:MAG: carotenoid oxygenase family protein, partial [Dongiaceae bacterium]